VKLVIINGQPEVREACGMVRVAVKGWLGWSDGGWDDDHRMVR
jgi:hypothetical protein